MLHPALAGDQAFLQRFRAEARAVAALNHPNILQVYDWGEEDGEPYLVLEYLAGGSLRQIYDTGALLTPEQAVRIGIEACAGLDYAHRRGLIHRDIKPANLLFDADGRLRIADFGLARALAEAAWTEPDGAILGTARYAAPEQVEGWVLDGKADVYALALVLYEGVTGESPFIGDTTVATLMARVGRPAPRARGARPAGRRAGVGGRPRAGRALRRRPASAPSWRSWPPPFPSPAPLPLVDAGPTRRTTPSGHGRRRRADPGLERTARPAEPGSRPSRCGDLTELGHAGAPAARRARRPPGAPRPAPAARPGAGGAGGPGGGRRRGGGAGPAGRRASPGRPRPSSSPRATRSRCWWARRWPRPTTAVRGRPLHRAGSPGTPRRSPCPPASIVSQQPAARSGGQPVTAKQGSTIAVVVSTGPPLGAPSPTWPRSPTATTPWPPCRPSTWSGCARPPARSTARRSAAGAVLGTSPTGHAPYGSTVTIVTSKGHAPVPVPAVAGPGRPTPRPPPHSPPPGFVPAQANEY